jgi:curved DNA-binding protein CbpA
MGPEMTRRFLYGLVLSGHLEVEGRKPPTLPRPSRRSRIARTRRKGGRKGVRRSVITKRKAAAQRKAPAKATPAEAAPVIEETFEEKIARLYRETSGRSHYDVLGIEKTADDGEIRKRYYELAKDFHPDQLGPGSDQDLREKLEELFGRFGEAYNVLRDKEARAEYDEQLAAGAAAHETKEVDPQQVAREAFEKGLVMMKADPAAAARFFQYAADTAPEKAEYWAHLGSALGKQSMSRKKAEEAFKKAISLDQTNAQNYFKLALLYKAGGLKSRAADMIRQGLSWDADNLKMQTMLSELEGTDDKKGGGLFRRK